MSAIAARLAGSKGTLYNYFKSKQDLPPAVIQSDCELSQADLFDDLDTVASHPTRPPECACKDLL